MTIELTQQEAEQLAALLDIATKASGLQVAAFALHMLSKIQAAAAAVAEQPAGTPKTADTPAASA